jgi:hypothetical protein
MLLGKYRCALTNTIVELLDFANVYNNASDKYTIDDHNPRVIYRTPVSAEGRSRLIIMDAAEFFYCDTNPIPSQYKDNDGYRFKKIEDENPSKYRWDFTAL